MGVLQDFREVGERAAMVDADGDGAVVALQFQMVENRLHHLKHSLLGIFARSVVVPFFDLRRVCLSSMSSSARPIFTNSWTAFTGRVCVRVASRRGLKGEGVGILQAENPAVHAFEQGQRNRVVGTAKVVGFREGAVFIVEGDRHQPTSCTRSNRSLADSSDARCLPDESAQDRDLGIDDERAVVGHVSAAK